jgi:hypothetical protein
VPSFPSISSVSELLKKISYKPGWKIRLVEHHDIAESFFVEVTYEGYDSEKAAFDPIAFEDSRVSIAREKIAISIGKTVRRREQFRFTRNFSYWDIQNMHPEQIIRYIIGDTIKQAEMYEFDRWFKFEGVPIFESKGEEKQ